MKIIDKIQKYIGEQKPFFSFEFFPPKTDAGLDNLYGRIERMAQLEPAFIDVTWGAGGSTSDATLEISMTAQKYFGLDVMMHLTCTNMSQAEIERALIKAQEGGLSNILALRGDPPEGAAAWEPCAGGFNYAVDLVKFARRKFGDKLGLAVGGYPEGHIEASSINDDVVFLKRKVDAGADFVVTQLFYDLDPYFAFVERCRDIGISCPIIPGVLPIHNYDRFVRFTEFCRTKVPEPVRSRLEAIKSDEMAVKEYGIALAVDMCQQMLDRGAPGIHFYTLNLESSVTEILERLGMTEDVATRRALPWRPSTLPNRRNEAVRPIFWSNRPRSYLARTTDWDDFPNGRWGDARSPSFGDLNDYYLIRRGLGQARVRRRDKLRKQWGAPETIEDVNRVFVNFCAGKVDRLPWCEAQIRAETDRISSDLVQMNKNGLLTINSQPQVNAAKSTAPDVGWGGPGGYVYQKAYVEFFIDGRRVPQLLELLKAYPTLTYHAVNAAGESFMNGTVDEVTAVTWGVFPGKQVIQPTVVDPASFLIWKDEAFLLWLEDWGALYEANSTSRRLLEQIHETYYLMNVVENDFIDGAIFAVFEQLYGH